MSPDQIIIELEKEFQFRFHITENGFGDVQVSVEAPRALTERERIHIREAIISYIPSHTKYSLLETRDVILASSHHKWGDHGCYYCGPNCVKAGH